MTERQFMQQVIALCQWLNLLVYHTHDSRRSQPGFPDLVIVGRGGVIYAELKTQKGRVTAEQRKWLEALVLAGQEAYVWRPSDMDTISRRLTTLKKSSLDRMGLWEKT